MITLTLPMAPTINHYYGQRRGGGKFIKPPGVKFRADVADIVADAGIVTMTGRVSLFCVVYFGSKHRTDIDNRIKPLQDALTHAGVYEDDCQIDDLHITRHRERVPGGQIKIVVRELDASEQ